MRHSSVKHALSGKRILITGTTGFLGKVILEKIIREVPDVAGVYLMIRGNRTHSNEAARFRGEVLTSTIFEFLRENDPFALHTFCRDKIHCVGGEITQEKFGLSEREYAILTRSVDVFIHSAASVNFHEPLDQALEVNARCLEQIAAFSADAGDIPVIQISTCYVNGQNNGVIREAVYPPARAEMAVEQGGYVEVHDLLSALNREIEVARAGKYDDDKGRSQALTDLGLKEANRYGWGDTYTFTKWIGEQILLRKMQGKTLTIVRPSVVESCLKEPKPGWIEGVKVTDAILLAYARDKVSYFPARKAGVVDIIPVDLVANAVLLSAAEAVMHPGKVRIYQACSGSRNPLGVDRYIKTICGEVKENWHKYPKLTKKAPKREFIPVNKTVFVAAVTAAKWALTLVDRLMLRGRDNRSPALKLVESTLRLTSIYATYTSPYYVFNNDRLMDLAERMGATDRALFPVDAALIDWDVYFREIHVRGLDHYGMEDRSSQTPVIREEQDSPVAEAEPADAEAASGA